MKKTEIKTTTYSYTKEYLVDVVETDEDYEAYIYTAENVFKLLMFGCPKEQQTKSEFLDVVDANMDEFITEYESTIIEEEDEWE